jgi:Flp pilus assembly protein TadG
MFSKICRILSSLRGNTSGNAAMMVAIGLPALVGASGLAVDTSQWYMWKRELQFAVDQAALAGAWARTDATTSANYVTRATQEYNASLQATKGFANTPTITLVNHGAGTANAVQVVATGGKRLPFSGVLVSWAARIRVSARATVQNGATYSGCIVALHPTAEGAFTLGGNASGSATCGVVALSNDADAAMVKNGNSSAQLGQLVAAGGIDADFSVNGTLHPNTTGLSDPFGDVATPDPSPSPSRTYSCPEASDATSETTATVAPTTVVSYLYVTGNNSNQALNNANNGTNSYAYTPVTAGSSTPGTTLNNVVVPTGTVNGTVPGTPAYTYVRQVRNSPKVHEVKKTVINKTYSNVAVVTNEGSDGIARPLPGTYSTINITCQTEFQPGIFVVDDIDFGQNQIVTGTDVLFVIKNAGGMHINSQSNITLSGITKDTLMGTYGYTDAVASRMASMVIFDKDTTDQLKINGNSDVHFYGILYMPSREVWLNGTAVASGECMMVVASQITFTGTVDLDNFCLPAGADTPNVGGSDANVKLVA